MKPLCTLLALVLVVAGCSTGVQAPREGDGSPPPAGGPPASAHLPADPGARVRRIDDIAFPTPSTGWLIISEGPTGGATTLLRSEDGGARWTDVTPASLPRSQIALRGDFLDANTGWLAFRRPGGTEEEMEIAHTADGGQSWSSSTLPVLKWEANPWISFVDPQQGWLLTTSTPATGTMFKSVYRTTDAGVQWELLSRGGGPGGTPTPEHLPNVEYVTGLGFRNDSEGWVSARYRTQAGVVALYRTDDGGSTWQRQPISLPETGGVIRYCDRFPPRFFEPNGDAGVLFLDCKGEGESASGPISGWVVPYFTQDGGRTWHGRSAVPGRIEHQGAYDFLNPDRGWLLLDSGALYMTEDGGLSWAKRADLPLKHGRIDFADEESGWAAGDSGPLYRTRDGGETWVRLELPAP